MAKQLKKPKLTPTQQQKPECEQCHKQFTSRTNLKRHIATVHCTNDETFFQCEHCNKRFSQKAVLKTHQAVHNRDLKPYKCVICDKSFIKSLGLRAHMCFHTGVKPFECAICEARFVREVNMKEHMVKHTGQYRYRCEICDKGFTKRNQFRCHTMDEHNTSQTICPEFASDLDKHMKTNGFHTNMEEKQSSLVKNVEKNLQTSLESNRNGALVKIHVRTRKYQV